MTVASARPQMTNYVHQQLCTGTVLGDGRDAVVQAKACTMQLVTETHDGFHTPWRVPSMTPNPEHDSESRA